MRRRKGGAKTAKGIALSVVPVTIVLCALTGASLAQLPDQPPALQTAIAVIQAATTAAQPTATATATPDPPAATPDATSSVRADKLATMVAATLAAKAGDTATAQARDLATALADMATAMSASASGFAADQATAESDQLATAAAATIAALQESPDMGATPTPSSAELRNLQFGDSSLDSGLLQRFFFATQAEGAVDHPAWTSLANQIHPAPEGSWQVRDTRQLQNSPARAVHYNSPLILVNTDYYRRFVDHLELAVPKGKQDFLAAAVLGHEEAHHVHGDSSNLVSELTRMPPLNAARLIAKLAAAISARDLPGFWAAISESMDPNSDSVKRRIRAEFQADLDGLTWASETSRHWAGQEDNGDTGVQVQLIFLYVLDRLAELEGKQSIVDRLENMDLLHPSSAQRAAAIRENVLQTSEGGLFGKITKGGTGVAGVKLTSPNGVWTETDEDGLYLLCPVSAGSQSISVLGSACAMAVEVETQTLTHSNFDMSCARVTWTRPSDGMVMVYVPAGEFDMGSNNGNEDEQPVHTVALNGFWLDRTEVTNAMFREFTAATGHRTGAELRGSALAFRDSPWSNVSGADWRHPGGPDTNVSGFRRLPCRPSELGRFNRLLQVGRLPAPD